MSDVQGMQDIISAIGDKRYIVKHCKVCSTENYWVFDGFIPCDHDPEYGTPIMQFTGCSCEVSGKYKDKTMMEIDLAGFIDIHEPKRSVASIVEDIKNNLKPR